MQKVLLLVMVITLSAAAFAEDQQDDGATVLVVYYSNKGHTKSMAEAVTKGAESVEGTHIRLLSIAEATAEDVLAADAVIVGSPVYKANVAPQVQEFINTWPIKEERLKNKIGAAFATGSGISAGEELVQMDIIHAMLVCQMIVVGGPNSSQPFGASAVTGEEPCTTPEEKSGEGYVAAHYLKKGEALGVRVAQIAAKMNDLR